MTPSDEIKTIELGQGFMNLAYHLVDCGALPGPVIDEGPDYRCPKCKRELPAKRLVHIVDLEGQDKQLFHPYSARGFALCINCLEWDGKRIEMRRVKL